MKVKRTKKVQLLDDLLNVLILVKVVVGVFDLRRHAAPVAEPSRTPSVQGPHERSFRPEHRVYCSVAAAVVSSERSTGCRTEEASTAGGAPGRGGSRTQASPRPPTLEDRTLDRGHLPPLPA